MQKIIERISKLLTLAENNKNESEAAAALLKARALMAKYNIEQHQCTQAEPKKVEEESSGLVAKAQWEEWLFALICKNFRCQGYYRRHVPIFIGAGADSRIASAVYRYAHRFAKRGAERAYRAAVRDFGTGRGIKASYFRGFVVGLKKQFEEAQKNDPEEMALVMIVPEEVNEYYAQVSKALQVRNFRNDQATSRVAYEQGYVDGNKMPKIHGAIEAKRRSNP